MDLSAKTMENMEYMVEEIINKLKMINLDAIKLTSFNEDMYEELTDIYEMVMKKDSFSPNEMQAIVEELGNLLKK